MWQVIRLYNEYKGEKIATLISRHFELSLDNGGRSNSFEGKDYSCILRHRTLFLKQKNISTTFRVKIGVIENISDLFDLWEHG